MFLEIIDSILDYSKLEASGNCFPYLPMEERILNHYLALKLEYTGFSVEDIIAVRFYLTQRTMRHTGI